MHTTHTSEVRQGVWIDERWLKEAGLGHHIQIITRAGEIRIRDIAFQESSAPISQKGWDTFRQLGNNAPIGTLENASERHDFYLYRA